MIDNLVIIEVIVLDIIELASPFQIEKWAVNIGIFNPAFLKQCVPKILVASFNDENLQNIL
jgi:hypothetical protein